jgi:mersacidin/lichenicidin family type 2 lantibiotic
MKKELIIRAWKDPEFRASLTAEERAALPESPSGRSMTELDEAELLGAVGGYKGGPKHTQDTYRCAAPTFKDCTVNSCGIVACPPTI